MWQFIVGAMVGAIAGVSLMCLFVAGGQADENMLKDIMQSKHKNSKNNT